MNNFFSLKVTRQGIADAAIIPNLILSVPTLFNDNPSWGYTLALSCLVFWSMDNDLRSKAPIFHRIMWWIVLLVQAFTHGIYFLAAKFL